MANHVPRPLRGLTVLMAALWAACAASPPALPRIISVSASSAAAPWLGAVYDCAPSHIAVRLSNPTSADIRLILGEPAQAPSLAFQIGTEDILVVVQPQTGISSLTRDQVQRLFSGQVTNWKDLGGTDTPVQVWTFSSGEDITAIFDQVVMHGEPTTSVARLAVSPQAMSDSVGTSAGSIGFLPRRFKAFNTTEALVISTAPVLALSSADPQGAIRDLLSCLQSRRQ